jgi:hypothetical protein
MSPDVPLRLSGSSVESGKIEKADLPARFLIGKLQWCRRGKK